MIVDDSDNSLNLNVMVNKMKTTIYREPGRFP